MKVTTNTKAILLVIETVFAGVLAAGGGSPVAAAAKANNAFAFDLYRQIASRPGNIIVSPLSVGAALDMALAGARGQTAEQLASVLHLRGNRDKAAAALASLNRELSARTPPGCELRIATSLWAQKGYPFLTPFQAGKWVVSYDENAADFWKFAGDNRILDPEDTRNGSIPGENRYPLWYHDHVAGHLGQGIGNDGWLSCASRQGTYPLFRDASHVLGGRHGQTFPKRGLYGKDLYPSDMELFRAYLKLPSAENFYGNGHGLPTYFTGLDAGGWKSLGLKRYRFAFLDGCFTAVNHDLLSAFGAQPFDFVEGRTVADYQNFSLNKEKFRPAAFLGWQGEIPLAFRLPGPLVDHDGKYCYYQHFTSRCNWHAQLLFQWTSNNQTLRAAIDAANATASLTFASVVSHK